MPRTQLRVAQPGEKPAESPVDPPKNLAEAVKRSERDVLITMRARLAEVIDGDVPPHTLAPLIRQLREVDTAIRQLDLRAKQEGVKDDRIPNEPFDASAV